VTSRPISGRVRMLVRILPVRQFAVRSSQITKPRLQPLYAAMTTATIDTAQRLRCPLVNDVT